MRNWNMMTEKAKKKVQGVFTVPMRNWNAFYKRCQNLCKVCFYSTYEELKLVLLYSPHHFPFPFLQYLWGIETQMDFLQRLFHLPFLQYLWGIETNSKLCSTTILLSFYSTYEELKHGLERIYIPNEEMFLQYLWGIETSKLILYMQLFLLVFTVPMRNWNLTLPGSIPTLAIRFYSTYEELKRTSHVLPGVKSWTFLQYLWGIET